MDFLGVGPLEFLLVLIIALLVVGPERLPEIARSIGKAIRDLRDISQSVTSEWQRELGEAAGVELGEEGLQESLAQPLKEFEKSLAGSVEGLQESVTQSVEGARESLGQSLKESQADIQQAFVGPSTPPDGGASPKPVSTPTSNTQTDADHGDS
jgi:sec-independent protein translocase protein TatB